jgi:hypothetical protein
MLCDKCGSMTRVTRTMREGDVVIRERRCVRCRADVLTNEKRVR